MALEQRLSLKLAQKLVMTPSLQQAIKLLQMTRLELDTLLTQELVENPVLEESSEVNDEEVETASAEEERPAPTNGDEINHGESMEHINFDDYFGDDYWETSGYASMAEDRDDPPIENSLSRDPDLYDHLLWQLHMAEVPALLREIGELIIGNLNPDGFLAASMDEIQAMGSEEQPYTAEDVAAALSLVRSFDPPGVACFDLQECLLSQLDTLGVPADGLARRVVAEAWDLVLKKQYLVVAKKLEVEMSELEEAMAVIRNLDNKPGRKFSTERTHYIEPDVFVRKIGEEYVIQLNDDGLPRLRVSRSYRRMLQSMRSQGQQSEAQQFIKEKIRSAVWLIKSLDQRQRTIYKVADSIVRQQREFLDRGIEHLRPMVLRDVAEDIGMHESTVSRVVSNKYMHTHRGLFPMKFFFHSGIDREYGENISSLTVKRKIEQLIAAEDDRRPLSDSFLRILNREGIQIARRTVAKYRDEPDIASSNDRKKVF